MLFLGCPQEAFLRSRRILYVFLKYFQLLLEALLLKITAQLQTSELFLTSVRAESPANSLVPTQMAHFWSKWNSIEAMARTRIQTVRFKGLKHTQKVGHQAFLVEFKALKFDFMNSSIAFFI